MNPEKSSLLKPAHLYQLEKDVWCVWNQDAKVVIQACGPFTLLCKALEKLGYYLVSPNSAIAMDIRNKLRDKYPQ